MNIANLALSLGVYTLIIFFLGKVLNFVFNVDEIVISSSALFFLFYIVFNKRGTGDLFLTVTISILFSFFFILLVLTSCFKDSFLYWGI